MTTFEQGFADAERAANSVLDSLKRLNQTAVQLRKAAQDGQINAIRRSSQRLQEELHVAQQEVANATEAWPFSPAEEQEYLQQEYALEIMAEGLKRGFDIFDRDSRLIAHPSILRVVPSDRSVEINRRKMSMIRPTRIVKTLEDLQNKPPRFSPQAFLDALYDAYLALCEANTSDRMRLGEVGQVVRLDRMYGLFTGLPGFKREYGLLDFARDLFALESSNVKQTKSGAEVSFPASTGTRGGSGTISFVAPTGETVPYYGIQFRGASK